MVLNIGARSNNKIVPVTDFTKKTKQVTLTLGQYGSDPIPNAITRVVGYAFCDSVGNYRLIANGRYTTSTSITRSRTRIYKDSLGDITFKNVANFYQAISCEAESLTVDAFGVVHPNSDIVDIKHSSGATSHLFSMNVELDSKPTWFDANIENTPDVSAYIPLASATETGIVTAGALPGIVSGSTISAGYIGQIINSSWSSPAIGAQHAKTTNYTISLTPGYWLIYGDIRILTGTGVTLGADNYQSINITTVEGTVQTTAHTTLAPVVASAARDITIVRVMSVSVNTTVYIQGIHGISTAGGSTAYVNVSSSNFAIRVG